MNWSNRLKTLLSNGYLSANEAPQLGSRDGKNMSEREIVEAKQAKGRRRGGGLAYLSRSNNNINLPLVSPHDSFESSNNPIPPSQPSIFRHNLQQILHGLLCIPAHTADRRQKLHNILFLLVRYGGVDNGSSELGISVEPGADGAKGLFDFSKGCVVGSCCAVQGGGVGSFEGVDCDGRFGGFGGGCCIAAKERQLDGWA